MRKPITLNHSQLKIMKYEISKLISTIIDSNIPQPMYLDKIVDRYGRKWNIQINITKST